ncbi:phage tail assembly chaperone [Terrarubrum flagellatum]|uniref:phage tail assembly chaperone n=1 Tax=Terrirubrum flagellatum TaxID=2895980 RepID=UPI00314555AC
MAFGFGVLRLSSFEFWSMSPRELAAAARGIFGDAQRAMRRDELAALIALYPDKETDDG